MAPMAVINRGFGGSKIPEVVYYADRIIKPHQPKLLVFYCGENDLANDVTKAKEALKRFKSFEKYMRKNLADTKVFFLSIKPSISREQYWEKMQQANDMIAKFISRKDNYIYVDVASKMLDENGIVLQDIFLEDNLHMNAKGYKIWTSELRPILEKHYTF
jgi:lysophospholipase L1-like esterase